tara:strand:- start:408 stop:722 length:315 start_codon:yes stop_codon:yes gene_type:complete
MNPLKKVSIILTVSILLGILIVPIVKKRSSIFNKLTTEHKTKNIFVVIVMSIMIVGGLGKLVWHQVGQAAMAKPDEIIEVKKITTVWNIVTPANAPECIKTNSC